MSWGLVLSTLLVVMFTAIHFETHLYVLILGTSVEIVQQKGPIRSRPSHLSCNRLSSSDRPSESWRWARHAGASRGPSRLAASYVLPRSDYTA